MKIIRYLADIPHAFENLRAQKTRTVLTALGIVFGVGSVIGMLAIGAGAREESLAFIEQLGVRNVLIESIPASSVQEMQQRRRASPGMTERDVRILEANVDSLEMLSPRRTIHPARALPKPSGTLPNVYGVRESYATIHNLRLAEGRFFTERDDIESAPVCVLGDRAKVSLLGYGPGATGKFVKVNDTWLEVLGVLAPQVASTVKGAQSEDRNNLIYIPFNTFQYRFWDQNAFMVKDDLDGIDLRLKAGGDSARGRSGDGDSQFDASRHGGLHGNDSSGSSCAAADSDDLHLCHGAVLVDRANCGVDNNCHAVFGHCRVLSLCGRRGRVRDLSGDESVSNRSNRGAAIRVGPRGAIS